MRKLFLKLVFTLVIVIFIVPGLLIAKSLTDDLMVPQEKDLGIGPVKKVELGPLNNKMVGEGKTIYTNQCIICHDLDQNKLGPALKNVTKTRTPEFIMNILLNPAQMQSQNATVKALLKQYNNLPMPDPALNHAKARSVLEYLRSLAK